MIDVCVRKIIARDGEREITESSVEEIQSFIVNQIRPEFQDDSVLCIKFVVSTDDSFEDSEETSWFVNPLYVQGIPMLENISVDEETVSDIIDIYGYSPLLPYGPKMAAEILPEILLIAHQNSGKCVFSAYDSFYSWLMKKNLTEIGDEEKYKRFIRYLRYF